MVAGLIVKPWLSVGAVPGMTGSLWLNCSTSNPSIRRSPVQLTSWNAGSPPNVAFGVVDGVNVQLVGALVTWPVIGFSPMSVNTSAATRVSLEQAARKSGCLHPHEGSEVSMAGSYSTDL